ncbi:hypothetical protein G7046_g8052 [Stylonectria norvegica]|nr:hypothetical protein G7046_g8052 [Stylonectria norvegica]
MDLSYLKKNLHQMTHRDRRRQLAGDFCVGQGGGLASAILAFFNLFAVISEYPHREATMNPDTVPQGLTGFRDSDPQIWWTWGSPTPPRHDANVKNLPFYILEDVDRLARWAEETYGPNWREINLGVGGQEQGFHILARKMHGIPPHDPREWNTTKISSLTFGTLCDALVQYGSERLGGERIIACCMRWWLVEKGHRTAVPALGPASVMFREHAEEYNILTVAEEYLKGEDDSPVLVLYDRTFLPGGTTMRHKRKCNLCINEAVRDIEDWERMWQPRGYTKQVYSWRGLFKMHSAYDSEVQDAGLAQMVERARSRHAARTATPL